MWKRAGRLVTVENSVDSIVFVIYVLLFIFHGKFSYQVYYRPRDSPFSLLGILITASQTPDKKYAYNIATVVLATEFLKLIVAIGCYWAK